MAPVMAKGLEHGGTGMPWDWDRVAGGAVGLQWAGKGGREGTWPQGSAGALG
jgi:hypothetical protein